MVDLTGAIEVLDLPDGGSVTFIPARYEEGEILIKPERAPQGIRVKALRVYVEPATKPIGAPYYDITSGTLIAQLRPTLSRGDFTQYRYKITKYGVAPAARFGLEVTRIS